jgi:sulfur carrier protein ThiS adenylyltransferase
MNNFNRMLLQYFSEHELCKIKQTRLLIIGCGGLGSNIANILTRSGFSKFILIDYDKVELKNLNRQIFSIEQCGIKKVAALKENLKKINKEINIKMICKKINRINLKKIIIKEKPDFVIEAVDGEETKKLIFELCLEMGQKVICASGVAGYGDCEKIKIKRNRNFVIVGDMTKSINDYKPLAPKVTAVAAIQADEVLRMVLNND